MSADPLPPPQCTQAQGEPGHGSGTDLHPGGDVRSQCPLCSMRSQCSVCVPQLFRAGPSTCCGCSGGGGSMARVWGAVSPARLALLLLLMAMCSKETCAAPWRAPAADDDVGVPYPDVLVDTDFVPQGKPRGPLGGLPEWRPVPEPGVDARGVGSIGWDPSSLLSSRTEAPAAPKGPERQKEALGRGRYPQRLSYMPKKITKEKAAHGTDAEPAHRDAFQQGIRHILPIPLGEREASQAAGTPALSKPGEAHHNWVYRFLRNPGVPDAGHANAKQVKVGWKFYLILAGASLGSILLGTSLCWLLIFWYRNRKRRYEAKKWAKQPEYNITIYECEEGSYLGIFEKPRSPQSQ